MARDLPLKGIRVIDFTQAELGPAATQTLGDFGAEVIKIERSPRGDLSRRDYWHDPAGLNNPVFVSMNRNKRSICVNIQDPKGSELIRSLAKDADVMVNNFRPDIMGKYGLGYEDIKAINPRLIYAYASGYGSTGPLSHKPGQDILAQALSGAILRKPDPRHPTAIYSTCLADYTGAMHLTQAILLALMERQNSGLGQFVEASLLNGMMAMQLQEATMSLMGRDELNWGRGPMTAVYHALDADFLLIGAFRDDPLKIVCRATGMPPLWEDERFNSDDNMAKNYLELRDIFQSHFETRERSYWLTRLEEADFLCAPVISMDEALESEQVIHNGMIWEFEGDGERETQRVMGQPVQLAGSPATFSRPAPSLGGDTDEILTDLLGLSDSDVAALRESGTVA